MTLVAGAHLGSYEVVALLGAGGMGEVYRARDTRLHRDVALKLLPEALARDHDRVSRFRREAQVLAWLNHPRIAAIHGLEETDGKLALVLELVEGETLSERLKRGPIPIDEALAIACQIAEGLEAAHEKGIVHRDLKPPNVKSAPDGGVKLLDFGLAKAIEGDTAGEADVSQSPTLSRRMTEAGLILGTAAYMSPEQARGKPVDKRTDIWAFGAVLFEMLAGKRPFAGETVSDTLAAVLKTDPDWGALPPGTPAPVRRLLARCLNRDAKKRLRDIGEARLMIEECLAGPETSSAPDVAGEATAAAGSSGRDPRFRTGPGRAGIAIASALSVVLGLALGLRPPWRQAPRPAAALRLSAELGADASLTPGLGPVAILSPDGSALAFAAQETPGAPPQLYVRRLDQLRATPLSGTEEVHSPFFSPDGRWIAFFAAGKLKKVSVTGGAAVTLCDAPGAMGGWWAEDGTIAFLPDVRGVSVLHRMSSAGGKPEPLIPLAEGEVTQRWPQVLPGGHAVLFTSHGGTRDASLVAQPLPHGERKIVQRGGYHGRYLDSGHLVYIQEGTLFAAPFDLQRLETTGVPVPALEGVMSSPEIGGAQFAFSRNGTLVYLAGHSVGPGAPIHWMDREGRTTLLRAAPANWRNPAFSPDGQRLAMQINDGKQDDVWVYDWERDVLTRVTFDPSDENVPAWTPDGRRITFNSSQAGGKRNLYWQRADGTGEAERLTESKHTQYSLGWHPSGRFLAFVEVNPKTISDLWVLPMEGDEASGFKPGTPTVFLSTPFNEFAPRFSPDGRWLGYTSNESGRLEVYVRPFPGPGGKWRISSGGGSSPTWSRTRRELFYLAPDGKIMVAPFTVEGDSLRAEKPRAWSEGRVAAMTGSRFFDLHPDGQRFAVLKAADEVTQARRDKVVFIFNFFDELRRIAPPGNR